MQVETYKTVVSVEPLHQRRLVQVLVALVVVSAIFLPTFLKFYVFRQLLSILDGLCWRELSLHSTQLATVS